jgi:hypothetical protein
VMPTLSESGAVGAAPHLAKATHCHLHNHCDSDYEVSPESLSSEFPSPAQPPPLLLQDDDVIISSTNRSTIPSTFPAVSYYSGKDYLGTPLIGAQDPAAKQDQIRTSSATCIVHIGGIQNSHCKPARCEEAGTDSAVAPDVVIIDANVAEADSTTIVSDAATSEEIVANAGDAASDAAGPARNNANSETSSTLSFKINTHDTSRSTPSKSTGTRTSSECSSSSPTSADERRTSTVLTNDNSRTWPWRRRLFPSRSNFLSDSRMSLQSSLSQLSRFSACCRIFACCSRNTNHTNANGDSNINTTSASSTDNQHANEGAGNHTLSATNSNYYSSASNGNSDNINTNNANDSLNANCNNSIISTSQPSTSSIAPMSPQDRKIFAINLLSCFAYLVCAFSALGSAVVADLAADEESHNENQAYLNQLSADLNLVSDVNFVFGAMGNLLVMFM